MHYLIYTLLIIYPGGIRYVILSGSITEAVCWDHGPHGEPLIINIPWAETSLVIC